MNRLQPKPDTNTYVYVGSLSVFGLAIGGYLVYSKFKKQEQTHVVYGMGQEVLF